MKCQILFSGKNKKNNIILSSAEILIFLHYFCSFFHTLSHFARNLILSMLATKKLADDILKYFSYFIPENRA